MASQAPNRRLDQADYRKFIDLAARAMARPGEIRFSELPLAMRAELWQHNAEAARLHRDRLPMYVQDFIDWRNSYANGSGGDIEEDGRITFVDWDSYDPDRPLGEGLWGNIPSRRITLATKPQETVLVHPGSGSPFTNILINDRKLGTIVATVWDYGTPEMQSVRDPYRIPADAVLDARVVGLLRSASFQWQRQLAQIESQPKGRGL